MFKLYEPYHIAVQVNITYLWYIKCLSYLHLKLFWWCLFCQQCIH